MTEANLIKATSSPVTQKTIASDLRLLGITDGDVLVVHSSLRSMGWVVGGASAVVNALLDAVGDKGTVTMPSHSGDWSDPSGWGNPPVPQEWWAQIREERPTYDPYETPLREMGAVAENFLLRRATLRSGHPLYSHMANGLLAELITKSHPLDDSFGDSSPLGRLYELDAKVVLIGVGHGQNTSLHLAEARAMWPGKAKVEFESKVSVDGEDLRVKWMADDVDADDFDQLGLVLDSSDLVVRGRVGQSSTRVARMRELVDVAIPWFATNR